VRRDDVFLGRGWAFPPSFGEGGSVVDMVQGPEDIHESLQILFATEFGERIMRPEFGCELSSAVFEEIDQGLISRLTGMIRDSVLYHEPRIDLEGVEIAEKPDEPGLLEIRLVYAVRGSNSRFNMVYPYYVQEGSAPVSDEARSL
jgi:phage baseplate assembly protein W